MPLSPEHLKKEIYINLPPRFMTVNQGLQQLLDLEAQEKKGIISKETMVVGIARLGCDDQKIISGPLEKVMREDFGKPVHCIIVPGKLHHIEEEALRLWQK